MRATHDPSIFLRYSLRANAWFSGLSGLVFLFAAEPLATFLGLDTPWIIRLLGLGLLGYAFWLHLIVSRPTLDCREVWSAIALDGAWVISSAVLLISDLLPLTIAGRWAMGITTDLVALFAVLQMVGLFKYEAALALFHPAGAEKRCQ